LDGENGIPTKIGKMKIKLCKTRYHYGSYTYFWKMVEAAGMDTCWVDEIDYDKDCVYIFTPINGETRDQLKLPIHDIQANKKKKCKIVWWNIERPAPVGLPSENPAEIREVVKWMVEVGFLDKVWVSDMYFKEWIDSPHVEFITFGSHKNFAEVPIPKEKDIDLAYLCTVNGRRAKVLNQLGKYSICPNEMNDKRPHYLARTKIMLNIHKDEWKINDMIRTAIAAAYKMCLLTELNNNPYPLTLSDYVILNKNNVKGEIKLLLEDKVFIKQITNNLHKLLTEQYRFDKCITQKCKDYGWN